MLKYSLNLVFRNKLRTFLTSLGITIAVILLSMIIFGMNGFKEVITSEFTSRFSPNEIIVTSGGFDFLSMPNAQTEDEEEKEPVRLTSDVIRKIEGIEGVVEVKSVALINGMDLKLKGQSKTFSPSFIAGGNVSGDSNMFVGFTGDRPVLSEGEVFLNADVASFYGLETNDVIGKTLVMKAGANNPLGGKTKDQLTASYEFKITGVIETGADRTDAFLSNEDTLNILAEIGGFDNGEEFLEMAGYDQLMILLENEDRVEEVKTIITDEIGLQTFSSEDILEFLGLITNGITLVLVLFGMVSAFVASIGIINTMVMSIYEQTREIGINKAVGASDRQVMAIFLVQSGMIGLLGGILGLSLVLITITATNPIIVNLLQDQGFTTTNFFSFDLQLVLGIILGCIVVGVLAGIYPAIKAARLDPVKALRYE